MTNSIAENRLEKWADQEAFGTNSVGVLHKMPIFSNLSDAPQYCATVTDLVKNRQVNLVYSGGPMFLAIIVTGTTNRPVVVGEIKLLGNRCWYHRAYL